MRNSLSVCNALLVVLLVSCSAPEKRNQTEPELLIQDGQFAMYKYAEQGQDRFAVRTTATARSGTFVMEVLLNQDLTVQETRILSYPLSRGRGVVQPEFLNQFRLKSPADPIRIGRDIHAVTAATLSSAAAADAVRSALAFAVQYKDGITP